MSQSNIGKHLKKISVEKENWQQKDEAFWKEVMTPLQFEVARNNGTEHPFSGFYNNETREGIFHCSACGLELFKFHSKFDSGCGWPSFDEVINKDNVKLIEDTSHGMKRVEVRCSRCDSHLGHVFNDGPTQTGLRYCMNSVSLIHSKDLENEDC